MQRTTPYSKNSRNETNLLQKKESLLEEILRKNQIDFADEQPSFMMEKTPQPPVFESRALNLEMSDHDIELNLEEIDRVIALKKQALQFYRKKNYIECLKSLESAIKLIPGDLDLIYYEAMCLFQLGNVERAGKLFAKLSALDKTRSLPNLPKTYVLTLLKQRKYREAETYLNQILREHSYDSQLRNMLGYCQERQDKLEEAEETYQKILTDYPDNCNAANSLAYVFYRRNRHLEKAINLVKKALEKEPENPAYLDTFGMLLHKKGNIPSARKALKKALELAPGNEEILSHINRLFQI